MRKAVYVFSTLLLFAVAMLASERRAYAYVDPGSSLVIYQGTTSLLLGAVYYFRRRLKALLLRDRSTENTQGR